MIIQSGKGKSFSLPPHTIYHAGSQYMILRCLEPGKFETLKMLDLQTKSAMNSICFQVQLQATSQASRITYTIYLSQHPDSI